MTNPIRILSCDDSATMRKLIKSALESDPAIQVVAQAGNGRDALQQLDSARPDLVLMDVEMPIMDGIDTVREIRKRDRKLPIIMFSSLTSQGAEATLDALHAGANDFTAKPRSLGNINLAIEQVRRDLVQRIKALVPPGRLPERFREKPAPPKRCDPTPPGLSRLHSIKVVTIGVSTGGPQALKEVLSGIPRHFPVPILIAQHMPPVFTELLAQRLSEQTGHQVCEAKHNEPLQKSRILLAPGDYHMVVEKNADDRVVVQLNQDKPENSCRPAVDPLFRSVARCFGRNALAVVLTGMGQDGQSGAGDIKHAGGTVMVQDESSSVVWGMPKKVIDACFADHVFPLQQIAPEIVKRVSSSLTSLTSQFNS